MQRYKKEHKIKRPLELSGLNFVGVDGLATPQINLLRLTPFRSARRGGPYKNFTAQ